MLKTFFFAINITLLQYAVIIVLFYYSNVVSVLLYLIILHHRYVYVRKNGIKRVQYYPWFHTPTERDTLSPKNVSC